MAEGSPDYSLWAVACGEYSGTITPIALTEDGDVQLAWED